MAERDGRGEMAMERWDTLRPRRAPTAATALRGFLAVLVVVAGAALASHVRHGSARSYVYAGAVKRVKVTVDSGSVDIVGTDREGANIAVREHALVGVPSPTSQGMADGQLRVVGLCPGGLVLRCRIDFRIEVPATALVEVTTGSADVTVEGMSRDVQVTTVHGRLLLKKLLGTSLQARTSTGTVTGSELAATQVAVRAKGDVQLALTTSPDALTVTSSKGAIDVSVPDAPYAVRTDSAIGLVNVEVQRNPDSRHAIALTAPEGDIRVHPAV